MPKLTKTIVDRTGPKDKQFIVWCGELKGFGVCVNPTGRKSYVVDYTTQGGTRRRMTIGKHGVITTEQARKMALVILGKSVQGEDPQLEKRTKRKSLTVSQLCDQYMEAAEARLILGRGGLPKKVVTLATDKGRILRHIKPLLGRKLVIDLRRSDVAKFLRDVTAGKTAKVIKSDKLRGSTIVTGGPGTAARSVGLLGGMLSFAISEGVIEYNPVHGIKKPVSQPRTRRLSPVEYRALGKTLDQYEYDLKAWQGIAMIRMAAFTGCRLGEIESLLWSEVDFDAQVLNFADTKTGQSTRPLSNAAIEVLKPIEREKGNLFVFPGPRGKDTHYGGVMRFYRGFSRKLVFLASRPTYYATASPVLGQTLVLQIAPLALASGIPAAGSRQNIPTGWIVC